MFIDIIPYDLKILVRDVKQDTINQFICLSESMIEVYFNLTEKSRMVVANEV